MNRFPLRHFLLLCLPVFLVFAGLIYQRYSQTIYVSSTIAVPPTKNGWKEALKELAILTEKYPQTERYCVYWTGETLSNRPVYLLYTVSEQTLKQSNLIINAPGTNMMFRGIPGYSVGEITRKRIQNAAARSMAPTELDVSPKRRKR